MPKFIIKDWAGNTCFKEKEFPSFEEAWEFLYVKFEQLSDKAFEEECQEYFVEEKTPERERRYLDPHDPRMGVANA